jgi:hypothetical protein
MRARMEPVSALVLCPDLAEARRVKAGQARIPSTLLSALSYIAEFGGLRDSETSKQNVIAQNRRFFVLQKTNLTEPHSGR